MVGYTQSTLNSIKSVTQSENLKKCCGYTMNKIGYAP